MKLTLGMGGKTKDLHRLRQIQRIAAAATKAAATKAATKLILLGATYDLHMQISLQKKKLESQGAATAATKAVATKPNSLVATRNLFMRGHLQRDCHSLLKDLASD